MPTASRTASSIAGSPRLSLAGRHDPDLQAAERRQVERMTPAQRRAAMWRCELSYDQCCLWARRWPDEVPLVNGEYAFIAVLEAEAAEADR